MTTIDGYELLPCPFCGNDSDDLAIMEPSLERDTFSVTCPCGAEGPADLGESGAIEAWNNQPNITLAERQRQALDELLEANRDFLSKTDTRSDRSWINWHNSLVKLRETYKRISSLSTMTGSSEQ